MHTLSKSPSLITLVFMFFAFHLFAQNIGINGTGANPVPSAILEVDATNKGILTPRLTTVERDAIVSPVNSLLIFNTTTRCFESYNAANSKWIPFGCKSTLPCNGGGNTTVIVDVTNPITGRTWMDRNLGASQVATSRTDAASFGDLYQWGRCSDGHEKRTSGTTTTLSPTDTPGHGDFIKVSTNGWRSTPNPSLWQGVDGINNPCPPGYRIPSKAEWEAEKGTWATNNSLGAFNSNLKLPTPNMRMYNTALFTVVGGDNFTPHVSSAYWTSENGNTSTYFGLGYSNGANYTAPSYKNYGFSVRCIKD